MTNLFLVPAANRVARENLERTVRRTVDPADLRGLSREAAKRARAARRGLTAWGTQRGTKDVNVNTWKAMEPGDWALFYSGGAFPFAGRVLVRERSREVAERLWGVDEAGETWEHMYLMDELRRVAAPRRAVTDALGYEPGFYPRGFIRVDRALPARYASVERMLADFAGVGEAVDRVVDALRDGDDVTAAVAIDGLSEQLPDEAARREAIASRTVSDPPAVRSSMQKRFARDRKLATEIKALYGGRCQSCDFTFAKPDGTPYSEAAHLRRISLAEADLDVKDNLLVLCPNHHKMLDYGAIEIEYDTAADTLLLHEDGKTVELANKHIGPSRP